MLSIAELVAFLILGVVFGASISRIVENLFDYMKERQKTKRRELMIEKGYTTVDNGG